MSESEFKKKINSVLIAIIVISVSGVIGNGLISWRNIGVLENEVKDVKVDIQHNYEAIQSVKERAMMKKDFDRYFKILREDMKEIKDEIKEKH